MWHAKHVHHCRFVYGAHCTVNITVFHWWVCLSEIWEMRANSTRQGRRCREIKTTATATTTLKTTMLVETLTANKSSSSGFYSIVYIYIKCDWKDARMMVAMTTCAWMKYTSYFSLLLFLQNVRDVCLYIVTNLGIGLCKKSQQTARTTELTARSYHRSRIKVFNNIFYLSCLYLQDNETRCS